MTDLDVLIAARAVIAKEENWWDGGTRMVPTQWCALEALAIGGDFGDHSAALAIAREIGGAGATNSCIPGFNDSHTHPEVLALFDRAIEQERARRRQDTIDSLLTAPCPGDAQTAAVPLRLTMATAADRARIRSASC
jgi:hypothetical protein